MLRETEIRPANLMVAYEDMRKAAACSISSQKDKFVTINCPACKSSNYILKFIKENFSFVSCNECETLFVNPRPSFSMLIDFYEKSECFKYWNDYVYPLSEATRRVGIFTPRARRVIELCEKYKVNNRLLVDVGAGFGTFLEEIEKLAFFRNLIAIEPSGSLAETCIKKGINVIKKPVEDVHLQNVDVVTNFELIEHLYNPDDFLLACRNILKVGGLLILTTPNIKGFDLSILGEKSDNIVAPNHINYFNPESIKTLLARFDFEVEEILTPGQLDVDIVRNKVLKKEFDLGTFGFLKTLLVDEWEFAGKAFQLFLAEHRLSSHLWVVARKKGLK